MPTLSRAMLLGVAIALLVVAGLVVRRRPLPPVAAPAAVSAPPAAAAAAGPRELPPASRKLPDDDGRQAPLAGLAMDTAESELQTLDVQKLLEVAMDYWDDPEYCLAAALLSPARLAWLEEAARRHPQEPRIQLAVIANWLSIGSQDAELLGWFEAFRQAAPDNALADYLAAGYWLRLERPDLAADLLRQALTKSTADSYVIDICDSLHTFATTAGLNEMSAAATLFSLPLPHVGELRRTSQSLNELARNLAAEGDRQSAAELANLQLAMGTTLQRSAANTMLIEELLAMAIQQQALKLLRDIAPAADLEQTATIDAQLDALSQRRLDIRQVMVGLGSATATFDTNAMTSYLDDVRRHGEYEAMRRLTEANHP